MLNRVILIGRLTRDPELRYTPNGAAVVSFTMAVERRFNRNEADFIPIVAWNKLAENCANYLGKGRLVAVEGRLQVRSYETQDGQRRWVTEVIADEVRFLDRGGSTASAPGSAATYTPSGQDDWNDVGQEIIKDIDFVDPNRDDDIPF
ncbi:MAG: single-stranded DNA-binding protein [Syntrophomonadaceae bacterium]|jgi:single-strand DNA-binding protein